VGCVFSILFPCFFLSCAFEIDFDRYAVVYGISDYLDGTITDLNFSDDDATELAALLEGQGYTVWKRTDADATHANLESDLAQAAQEAGGDDLFVFFFSGHGCQEISGGGEPPGGDGPSEGIVLNVAPNSHYVLTDDELGEHIREIPSNMKVVIIDACNSGGFIGNQLESDGTPPEYGGGTEGFGDILRDAISLYNNYDDGSYDIPPSDAIVLAASGEQETSFESSDYGHGIFSYFLLESARRGDHDGDGAVTALEAFYYAKEEIEKEWNVLFTGTYEQSPHISGGPVDFYLFDAE
jgi:hypothetical protein